MRCYVVKKPIETRFCYQVSTCTLFTELSASQEPLENFLTAWRDFVERRSELVVEVETLYGTVVHKLVDVERAGGGRCGLWCPTHKRSSTYRCC